jgi:Ca2+/Na+ antiporter
MAFVASPLVAAIRTAEEWSTGGVIGAFVLLFLVVLGLIWALFVTGRR